MTDDPRLADATPPALPRDNLATDPGWQHLPRRGTVLAAIEGGLGLALACGFGAGMLSRLADLSSPWLLGPAGALAGAAIGAWFGVRRHRRTLWKLDEEGFGLQRGRWWRTETRVPISRVQHLDLKRGPLERAVGLATLVIHTAGTRMASVSVSGLDGDDAERLRDRLARQLDPEDDAL
jgi:membrane protein YdbS with pleckstrin-like domain